MIEIDDGRVRAKLTKTTMTVRVYTRLGQIDLPLVDLLRDARMSTTEAYALAEQIITRDASRETDTRSQLGSRYRGKRRAAFVLAHGTRCHHCRRKGDSQVGPDGRSWHIDHLIPVAAGGTNEPANLALSCAGCNMSRGCRG